MLIKGSLYYTNNPAIVQQVLHDNGFVITLEEGGSMFDLNLPNISAGTILLPPPEAFMAAIDGNEQAAIGLYRNKLLSDVCMNFIAVMLCSLSNGKNLLIFAPQSTDGVINFFMNMLISLFMELFGIKIGTDTVQFAYANNYFSEANIISLIYFNSLCNIETFLKEFPRCNNQLNTVVSGIMRPAIERYCFETGFGNITPEEKWKYFCSTLANNNVIMPFIMEQQEG